MRPARGAIGPPVPRRSPSRWRPMLDMAFQLLAFFILTFKSPSAETHVDLDLPATPAALPARSEGRAQPRKSRRVDTDLENDLLVRAEADDLGDLKALRLGEATVPDLPTLGRRLRATRSSSRAAPCACASSPTIACATSRPRRSSPPARRRASPRSGSRPRRHAGAAGAADRGPQRSERCGRCRPAKGGIAMNRPGVPIALLMLLLAMLPASACGQDADPDREPDDRLGLADLAAYRAALSGRPTADLARTSDPPAPVGFRDLWGRPEAYRGRRVTVDGRVERTFRQGAVGSFPPLVEAWVFSAAGDPICVVYPRPDAPAVAEPGRTVRFTGTFLKMVRYKGGDGDRLAPLIVGDRPPDLQRPEAGKGSAATPSTAGAVLRAIGGGGRDNGPAADRGGWMLSSWALGLVLAAVCRRRDRRAAPARRRLHGRAAARRWLRDRTLSDPPRFVDSPADASR